MNRYRLIILEDQVDDAERMRAELWKLVPSMEIVVARNREEFQRAFDEHPPDLVIAEYQLSDITGLEALDRVRRRDPDLPFILCSGAVGEEHAVDAIRQGVTDYALKSNLERLGAMAVRELRQYQRRIQEKRNEVPVLRMEREVALNKLRERVKEQTCLYRISAVEADSVDELLQESVDYLPHGFQYPDITEACIRLQETSYTTPAYRETEWALKEERRCMDGRLLQVCTVYLEQRPPSTRGVFLLEETRLIASVADHLNLKIDRLLAQQELLEKERQLEAMSEVSRTGYWELDIRDKHLIWSPITRRIHEVDEEYTPDLETAIRFYKEGSHRETLRHRVQEAMTEGVPFDEELLLVTAKGREIWVRAMGEPVGENGEWRKLRGSFQDIDDRKRAQLTSEQNRLFLDNITRQAETPIWVHDEAGRYLFVNKEWRRLFQKVDADVLGKTVYDLFDRENAAAFRARDRQVQESGTSKKFEESVTGPDGTRYFLTTRFPMSNIPEIGKGVGGVATEITERKRMEEKLRFDRRLLDEIGEAVISTNAEGTIIYWNRAAEELYGWTSEETVGKNILDVTPSLAARSEASEIMNLLRAGQKWSGEIEVLRKDGSAFLAEATNSPVFDRTGTLEAIIGISSDITERKANEERILKSLHEKELLLEEIHHRVKNNLAIVSSLLTLQADELVDEDSKAILENCQNRIQSIAMVHELLYQADNFADVSFDEYIDKLVDALWNTIGPEEKKIEIGTKVMISNLNINQAIPLGLLLNEVITNSLKHAFGGLEYGRIDLAIHRRANAIEVRYEDNGEGYPEGVSFNESGTMGHLLMHTLMNQLGAVHKVDTRGQFLLEFRFEEEGAGAHSLHHSSDTSTGPASQVPRK